jgi:cytochrome c2
MISRYQRKGSSIAARSGRWPVFGILAFAIVALAGASWADERPAYPDAFEACAACHAYRPGAPALEGPTLVGVYGRQIASVSGFDYSQALRHVHGTWDAATLDRWLTNPSAFAPGTYMSLGGLRTEHERQEVIAFLRTLTPTGADKGGSEKGEAH